MPIYEHDPTPSTVNRPQIVFPAITGLLVSGAVASPLTIPMTVTSYVPPKRNAKTELITSIPLLHTGSNLSYGGTTVAEGNVETAKISVEGFIDTPTIDSGNYRLPYITLGGNNLHYADLIIGFIEGRWSVPTWQKINPTSFRDPYGRVYNNPRIWDFNATFVEGVPGRTNISLTLIV